MKYLLLAALAAFFTPSLTAHAQETGCDNWATMTQVLVARWQHDENFKDKKPADIKSALRMNLGNHPEITIAESYVDLAWTLKNEDVQDVYKIAYDECSALKI